jgi:DNA-binding CsgD family transcriptional regulator
MGKLILPANSSGRSTGLLCSVLYSGLFSYEAADVLVMEAGIFDSMVLVRNPLALLYLALALASMASVRIDALRYMQPLSLLATTPIIAFQGANAFLGLGFAGLATVFLLRLGFFLRRPVKKAVLVSVVLTTALLGLSAASRKPLLAAGAAALSGSLFFAFTLAVARGRLLDALAPKIEVVSLRKRKLSYRERQFVLERVGGKSTKAIARDNGLSESSVRSILSTGCRKLGLPGCEGLMTWAATRILE